MTAGKALWDSQAQPIDSPLPNAAFQLFTDAPRRISLETVEKNPEKEDEPNAYEVSSTSLTHPWEQNSKVHLTEFTAEKAIWQPCTGNRSYVESFFNLSDIHKSSVCIKST